MNPNLLSPVNALPADGRCHVYQSRSGPLKSPQGRGTAMTEQSRVSICEQRRDPLAALAQLRTSDGIDLPVHQPKAPALKASLNFALRKTQDD